MLSEIEATIHRFIACNPETAQAATLWIAFTWFLDAIHVAPLAVITAPEKRCGKSQLLTLISKLVDYPLPTSNITASAMFRVIERDRPTLIIDEADTFLKNEETRGILNTGHTRDNAFVMRSDGKTFEPRRFSVFGAKAIAGIGHLAETLMDRAIILELRRKLTDENVERLRYAEKGLFENMKAKLARFAEDYFEAVENARPHLPDELNDRAQDNWEPLFAIADVAGADWSVKARKTALKISGNDEPAVSTSEELLSDIQGIFAEKADNKISTKDLIFGLCDDEEKPWATYNRGKEISPSQVAKRLKSFGIISKNIRTPYGRVVKGYEFSQFQDAFNRYLSSPANATELQSSIDKDSGVAEETVVAANPLRSDAVCPNATPQVAPMLSCSGVAHLYSECPDIPD